MMHSLQARTTSVLPAGFAVLMARAVGNIGMPGFYESIVELVRQMIPCDFWIIARYDALSRPLILSENGMNVDAKALYSDQLWQRDPLSRETGDSGRRAISLHEMRLGGSLDTVYSSYVQSALGIEDELALLFPISGDSFLALCLDRQRLAFSQAELELARELQTMLIELHRQHVLRSIDQKASLFLHRSGYGKPEIMILSANQKVLYKTDTWSDAAIQAFEREPQPSEIGGGPAVETFGRDGWSMVRLKDDGDNAILSGADIFLLRRATADPTGRIEQFAKLHRLTERQRQIVALSLQGHPNAQIASKLGISVGGVKNHKLRLYEKLDITSERELLSTVLASI